MKKRTAVIAAVVMAVALAAVPLVYAQGMRHRAAFAENGPGGFGFLFGRLAHAQDALGLTDDQVTQIKAIATDLRTQNAPYRAQLKGGMSQIAQILLADPSNTAGAQAIIDQQATAHKGIQTNTLAAASKALSVLTPDQRAKVAAFLAARAAHAPSH